MLGDVAAHIVNGGSMLGSVIAERWMLAHCLGTWWLNAWRNGGSYCEWWLNAWTLGGSMLGNVEVPIPCKLAQYNNSLNESAGTLIVLFCAHILVY